MEQLTEFIGNNTGLSLAWVGIVVALIFTETTRRFRGFSEVSPGQATQLINREDATLVDIRSMQEFQDGHIVNAKHILLSKLDPSSKQLAAKAEQPVVVYCQNGNTSLQGAARLAKAGFKRVYSLKGGLTAWQSDQLPLARGRK